MEELKQELISMEKAVKGMISVHLASPLTSRMYNVMVELGKKPVCTLEIEYSVFFQWNRMKELNEKLSHSTPSFCKLLDCSIPGSYSINECERLENRLKKASSDALSKYKSLKGQHRALHKTKITRIQIYDGEIAPALQESKVARLPGYKDYDDLGPKQKKRRLDEIGKKTSSFLNDLGGNLGLVPKFLNLVSTKKNETVPVPLDHSSQNSSQEPSANSTACSETNREDVVDRMLYLIMKHNVPMEFYHEMAAVFPELPRSYKVKSRKYAMSHLPITEMPEGEQGIKGSQFDFIELLKDRVAKQIEDDSSAFPNYEVKIKISLDGAKYSRHSSFCILSFTMLHTGGELNSSNVHTVAIAKCSEDYETLSQCFSEVFLSINKIIREPTLLIDDTVYTVEIFLCSDYKMILLLMGLKEASSTHACAWCTISKDNRWDADVDDTEYLITLKHTLVSLYEDTENDRNGCKNYPLIDIEPDNIIPDELHLLLRITDVLTDNLIIAARLHDKQQNRRCKLLEGPMVTALLENIRSCGVSFKIWEKRMPTKEFEFTSLMGNCKKKLLRKLPAKFSSCQPACLVEDVTDLWKKFLEIYDQITSRHPDMDYGTLNEMGKKWIAKFHSMDDRCVGYKPSRVTPYMHIMAYHAPDFIRRYGNIKMFSCQAVEKKNDDCKRIFFHSSKKWFPTLDMLMQQENLNELKHCEREKRGFNKENDEWWENGGIIESRARQRQLCYN